jgi:hypothetical protein
MAWRGCAGVRIIDILPVMTGIEVGVALNWDQSLGHRIWWLTRRAHRIFDVEMAPASLCWTTTFLCRPSTERAITPSSWLIQQRRRFPCRAEFEQSTAVTESFEV